jgi:hypothetical protein
MTARLMVLFALPGQVHRQQQQQQHPRQHQPQQQRMI